MRKLPEFGVAALCLVIGVLNGAQLCKADCNKLGCRPGVVWSLYGNCWKPAWATCFDTAYSLAAPCAYKVSTGVQVAVMKEYCIEQCDKDLTLANCPLAMPPFDQPCGATIPPFTMGWEVCTCDGCP
jgi:hypothetical protein